MWIALVNHPEIARRDLSSLRVCSSGGAALPHEISCRLTELTGLRLGGGWGMTETSPAGTNLLPDRPRAPGEIGVPLPGVEMDVVATDDPRRVLPPGEIGEVRDPRPQRHARLLEPAGGERGRVRGRLVPDRRYGLDERGRRLHPGGPQEGHADLRRLQRVSAGDRGRDPRASGRQRSRGDRRARRLSRPGGEGLCDAARGRAAADARGVARVPGRQAGAARAAGGVGSARSSCRIRRWASWPSAS